MKWHSALSTNHRAIKVKHCEAYRNREQGIVLTEYLIGTLVVVIALIAPLPGVGDSAFMYLLDSLRNFQANATYLMSMP